MKLDVAQADVPFYGTYNKTSFHFYMADAKREH